MILTASIAGIVVVAWRGPWDLPVWRRRGSLKRAAQRGKRKPTQADARPPLPEAKYRAEQLLDNLEFERRASTTAEGSVGYRLTTVVEGFIGLRYTDYQLGLSHSGPLQDRRVTAARTFYDPIVGVRAEGPIGKRWKIQGRVDVGGFGVGMDLTWRVEANIGFEASRLVDIWFGYVVLGQDFDAGPNDRLAMDVVYQGPQLGVFFKF